jgi:tRNA threonylcarbamoyladenosine modification (KEOPS) complex  Pcc1 subunit
MSISAEITFCDKDADRLFRTFQPEIAKKDRSGFELKKEKDCVKFIVEAKDSVALRATLNSITKLITVYEKARGML